MGIIVVGSLNYDLVTYTDRIPVSGETFKANYFATHSGGKGLNQAIAISKLSQKNDGNLVSMVGNVGNDIFGKELIFTLQKNNVNIRHVGMLSNFKTGVAVIIVEQSSGQNRILITSGANEASVYTEDELETIFVRSQSHERYFVVFQNEIPNSSYILHWLKQYRPEYQLVLNPSPFQALDKKDWSTIDLLVVNEIEALQIAESLDCQFQVDQCKKAIEQNFIEGYKMLASKFQTTLVSQEKSATIVITLGERGVVFGSKNYADILYLPAEKVSRVVDTTGAGDTFLGATISRLYDEEPLHMSIEYAIKASSITITRNGAAESIPTHDEVLEKLK